MNVRKMFFKFSRKFMAVSESAATSIWYLAESLTKLLVRLFEFYTRAITWALCQSEGRFLKLDDRLCFKHGGKQRRWNYV